MNKEGEDYFYVDGGFVIPAFIGDTWTVKVGKATDGTKISFSFSVADGQDKANPANYVPINGRLSNPNGSTRLTQEAKGGLSIVRGVITRTGWFRVDVSSDQENDIDVHIQVGTNSYIGVISTKDEKTYFIEEEMTLEEALKSC